MEVKPIHIIGASVFAFFAIVAANMVTQYRSNAEFRERLSNINPQDLLAIRTKRVAEENMTPQPVAEDDDEE